MALNTNANFQAAIADQLARPDLTSQIVDCITLFESEALREVFRNRGAEKTTILIPTNPAAITVTGAANNGSGLIRLTVSGTSTLSTGQEVGVSSVGGTVEANDTWIITVIDGFNIDLQGSVFTNAYTSGGVVQAQIGVVALPSDYLAWRRVTWTGNPNAELEYVEPSIIHAYYPTATTSGTTGAPQYFTIEGSTLYVRPLSGTHLEFDYYGLTSALANSLNWLFLNHIDCYNAGVLEKVYMYYIKDYDQAAIWKNEKLASYDLIKKLMFRENTNMAVRVMGICP